MKTEFSLVIADDESLARRLCREYLKAYPQIHILAEAQDGQQALELLQQHQPDLVLLDIQMPALTGLEVLQASGKHQGVIFTTAYDHYALQAFDLHAVDYLLKPFDQTRFAQALDKAIRQIQAHDFSTGVTQILQQQITQQQYIVLRERQQNVRLELSQILFIEAQDDYILIHSSTRDFMKTQSLSDFAATLPDAQFIRCHRSYLVNREHIAALEKTGKDSLALRLKQGQQIAVSRSGAERLKASGFSINSANAAN